MIEWELNKTSVPILSSFTAELVARLVLSTLRKNSNKNYRNSQVFL